MNKGLDLVTISHDSLQVWRRERDVAKCAAIEAEKIVLSAGMNFGDVGSTNSLFVVEV